MAIWRSIAVTLVATLAVPVIAACDRTTPAVRPAKPTKAEQQTTHIDNPSILAGYPPLNDVWEIAIDLPDSQQRHAAEIAGQVASLTTAAQTNREDSDAYRMRVVEGIGFGRYPPYDRPRPITGGETYKVVRVTQVYGFRVDVAVCNFFTPGIFRDLGNGELFPWRTDSTRRNLYFASSYDVEFTTRPDDLGRTSSDPRWLVAAINDATKEDFEECEKNNPFANLVPPQPTVPR